MSSNAEERYCRVVVPGIDRARLIVLSSTKMYLWGDRLINQKVQQHYVDFFIETNKWLTPQK